MVGGCLAFRQHFSSIVFVIKISTAFNLEYMSSLLILLKFYILLLIKIKENIISIIQSAPSLRSTPPPSFQFFFATSNSNVV